MKQTGTAVARVYPILEVEVASKERKPVMCVEMLIPSPIHGF